MKKSNATQMTPEQASEYKWNLYTLTVYSIMCVLTVIAFIAIGS